MSNSHESLSSITLEAHLRDTKTGATHVSYDKHLSDDAARTEYFVWWLWTQGNYGCDCNRHAFMYHDGDDTPLPEGEDDEFVPPCCDTDGKQRFALDKLIRSDTGEDLLVKIGRY